MIVVQIFNFNFVRAVQQTSSGWTPNRKMNDPKLEILLWKMAFQIERSVKKYEFKLPTRELLSDNKYSRFSVRALHSGKMDNRQSPTVFCL